MQTFPVLKRAAVRVLLAAAISAAQAQSAGAQNQYQSTGSQNQYLGPNITRTYSSAELNSSYGLLDVGKDELWMLNFPDTVTDVLTTREGVIDTKMMGNSVAIAAILTSGQLPVAVKLANGNTCYFLVKLSPSRGGGIKNIVVTDSSAAQPTPAVPASVTAQPTGDSAARYTVTPKAAPAQQAASAQPRQQAPAMTYQQAAPQMYQQAPAQTAYQTQAQPQAAAPQSYQQTQYAQPQQQQYAQPQPSYPQAPVTAPARSAPALSPAQASGGVSAQAATYGGVVSQQTQGYPGAQAQQSYPGGFPAQAASGQATSQGLESSWVSQVPQVRPQAAQPSLQAQFALQLDGNMVVLYYRLNNPGAATFTLNDQAIVVTSGGQQFPVSGRGPLTLGPGMSSYGTVTLPAGQLRVSSSAVISWNATQQDTGAVTMLQSSVAVQQASLPNWSRMPLAAVQGAPMTALAAWR